LQPSAFQIVNVNGNGIREIGFWTPRGLVNTLDITTDESTYRTSNSNPLTIIWPGDKSYIPMGWEIPINGRRLRIGVPMKGGFNQLLTVTRDPKYDTIKLFGNCIVVFEAVVKTYLMLCLMSTFPWPILMVNVKKQ